MKYALIGCGRIAVNHIKAAINNKLQIVAVCDVIPEKMEILLQKHGPEKELSISRYANYKKMIEETKPDFVSIATESGKHAEIALWCIDHGVHVIIEKPMAMNMKDADEIVRRSGEKNIKVAACHQNRFNIAVQKMRQALEEGRFGKLSHGSIHVRWNRNTFLEKKGPSNLAVRLRTTLTYGTLLMKRKRTKRTGDWRKPQTMFTATGTRAFSPT